jgi:hypothetical protein
MLRSLGIVLWLIAALTGRAADFQETFASDPAARGWRNFGDASLHRWNATSQNLEVTWDSSRTNSFYYVPLGTILGQNDDFSVSFELRLTDIRVGSTTGKSNEFQIAVGLLNYSNATNANAFRGSGVSPAYGVRNTIEFNYFPDAGYGATFATVAISTNNRIYPVHNFPLVLTTGDTFRIALNYTASNQLLRTSATRNASPYGMPPNNSLGDLSLGGRQDFRVDSFAVISYSDVIPGAPLSVQGSVLAHGTVDNIEFTVPLPVTNLRLSRPNANWQATFSSRTNWSYSLERSVDLVLWEPASAAVAGNNGTILLTDPNGSVGKAFYRVRAGRP